MSIMRSPARHTGVPTYLAQDGGRCGGCTVFWPRVQGPVFSVRRRGRNFHHRITADMRFIYTARRLPTGRTSRKRHQLPALREHANPPRPGVRDYDFGGDADDEKEVAG